MPNTLDFSALICADLAATIANGATTSGAVDLTGTTLVGLHMPAAFTATAVTFTVAESAGGTYRTLYSAGADVTITVAAAKYVALDPSVFAGARFIRIVSGAAEGAARTIILATRPV